MPAAVEFIASNEGDPLTARTWLLRFLLRQSFGGQALRDVLASKPRTPGVLKHFERHRFAYELLTRLRKSTPHALFNYGSVHGPVASH